ncbi:hypothetical protein HYR54_17660 [Candidatus Acetothermia bacterium]|nr:hypothetical protein [Candidatus Acetothermia bacterium]MBI3459739.1 hypothetical protein [Candidatus Acetothermia bacterium]MBI3659631.1 hypothetical protein [Candidatus Acetothermia bacterium]
MAGFRLWEGIGIDDLLDHLKQAVFRDIAHEYGQPSKELSDRLEHSLKRVLNHDIYASPACGTSSLCAPSEEGRVKPWSRKSKDWGLVMRDDPSLEKDGR